MPRIIGIDIPAKKKLKISLTYIYGIGSARSDEIIKKLKLDPEARASELTEEEVGRLNSLLQSEYTVEGDLRRRVQSDIKRLIAIHSYRGQRHRLSLPVRGQRTKTNSRTRKGKRKTVAGKKK
ncbi:ribosomal protein S13 [Chlamydia pneumoniae TW-183]|uniref:Small ribosomal subunit protein uS13 n=2 Tax=Chlamydia pneumoniae TaxID=83558 RepID=RS13_CHLPN|nr:30S ribosomal protein S13 [Chlamydia pneumoniae]Q9Z7S6.1 RecName: Full=Small ribosomal subunit protein uS13; AltName: Full=30S ribosomal protein S13 [Chlamydia pneumoniae]AAD18767.1 S13 Ribosomal Protein [Chlamydia pneumoniae CWL029]AAF38002.1 ribosomal protein S13 [Chlamydia pneumoniae AR39]AAP98583.1 ribosomal protein S13 [Chlamydia pneumoniae TW-183]ACZ32512.1 ribosomal protein S13 [Chlamydia pneumoniae LPCoLN]ETR80546.1 SSU ribosomal protein S13p (S18e) [Chlamydia pneumoniae B21]